MNEIELIWVRKTFYKSFILTRWSTIHHESFRGFFGSHSAFFLLLIFILWVTNTFINFLLNFRSKHLWNICNRKVLNWRKLCSTIFHSVLEFQVRHSNKGPTLTDDKNWISIFYTSDSKYKRAYKNWKMVFLLWPIVR